MLRALIAVLVLLTPAHARAQSASSEQEIAAEARYVLLDGPEPGEQRGVSVWRPPNAPARPLPVLYMADGVVGLNVVTPRLRPAILSGAMPPVLVIAIASSPQHRREEYVPRATSQRFEAHQRWFFNTVMPWAERVAGASNDPAQRAIGGFSNGADFALATAARRKAERCAAASVRGAMPRRIGATSRPRRSPGCSPCRRLTPWLRPRNAGFAAWSRRINPRKHWPESLRALCTGP